MSEEQTTAATAATEQNTEAMIDELARGAIKSISQLRQDDPAFNCESMLASVEQAIADCEARSGGLHAVGSAAKYLASKFSSPCCYCCQTDSTAPHDRLVLMAAGAIEESEKRHWAALTRIAEIVTETTENDDPAVLRHIRDRLAEVVATWKKPERKPLVDDGIPF
jgi:hypothetical protein